MNIISCEKCLCAKCFNKECDYYCNEKIKNCDLGIEHSCIYFIPKNKEDAARGRFISK